MQVENPYLYWYLVVIGIFILHGIFEGWCESQLEKNTDLATLAAMLGFAIMMILDVALG